MKFQKLRRLVGLVILLISLLILFWGLMPGGTDLQTVPVFPEDMQLPVETSLVLPEVL